MDVFPDGDKYLQACYPEGENHPNWEPVDALIGKVESIADRWTSIDICSFGKSRLTADFFCFRIVGNICVYTIDSGPGSFYDIYHDEGMTGLEFRERRFAP
jgi:hypothetical protein